MYVKMPFGLMNAGATLQREMNITFTNEKDRFILIYLDDITVFSKTDEDRMLHLRIVFQKYRKYGISLIPKKTLFGLGEGNIIGHIISKDGIRIGPNRVESMMKIDPPRKKKKFNLSLAG